MAIQDYITGANMKYVGIGIVLLVIIFFLLRFLGGGGWTREREEREEINEEKDLLKTTKKELNLQKQEKKDLKNLIGCFNGLLDWYTMLVSSIESSGSRKNGFGQPSLTPDEILKVLQTIISMLNGIKKENTTVRNEESTFDKAVSYWNIAFKEINAWGYLPSQKRIMNFQKANGKVQELGKKINDKIVKMGMELRQEEQFDEQKKKEILEVYQKVIREEGTQKLAA